MVTTVILTTPKVVTAFIHNLYCGALYFSFRPFKEEYMLHINIKLQLLGNKEEKIQNKNVKCK